jgi:hypothetical protein
VVFFTISKPAVDMECFATNSLATESAWPSLTGPAQTAATTVKQAIKNKDSLFCMIVMI